MELYDKTIRDNEMMLLDLKSFKVFDQLTGFCQINKLKLSVVLVLWLKIVITVEYLHNFERTQSVCFVTFEITS